MLYQRQGVQEYWIADAEKDAVDVWRFDEEPSHERVTDTLTLAIASEGVGEIDLEGLFSRE